MHQDLVLISSRNLTIPVNGQIWRHTGGKLYEVLLLSNMESQTEGFRPTVVYQEVDGGRVWSRPLLEWHPNFTQVVDN